MKNIIIITIITLFASTALAGGKEAVVKHFIGPAEKTALDATWTSSTTFSVGVKDNGTSRNGYAQYICAVLPDFGINASGITVKIIDVVQLHYNKKWVTLGKVRCR